MGSKPQTGGPKKPPPAKKMTQAEQSERFIKAARELGVDETGAEFERAFEKIVSPKRRYPRARGTGNVPTA